MAAACRCGMRTNVADVPPDLCTVISATLKTPGRTSSPSSTPPISRRPAARSSCFIKSSIASGSRSFIVDLREQFIDDELNALFPFLGIHVHRGFLALLFDVDRMGLER